MNFKSAAAGKASSVGKYVSAMHMHYMHIQDIHGAYFMDSYV